MPALWKRTSNPRASICGGCKDFMAIEGASIGNKPWPNIALSLSVNTGELYQHVAKKQEKGLVVVLNGWTARKLLNIRENGYCGEDGNRIIHSALDCLQRKIEEEEREKEQEEAQASTV